MIKFTIITSCYNSSDTLIRTYQSLVSQSYKNFEWILVDDCSSDGGLTRSLILEISKMAPFDVKYKFLDCNYFGAKSTYEACKVASGQYVCILDHDDQLLSDALSTVSLMLSEADCKDVIGVCGRCINEHGLLLGRKFPLNNIIANEGDIRFRLKITSELIQFTKTELIMKEFANMKPGYTNGFVWAKLSENFKYVYTNQILRVYDTGLATSYSNSKIAPIRYPDAKAKALISILNSHEKYLRYNISYSFKMSGSLVRHLLNANMPLFSNMPRSLFARLLFVFSIPFGYMKSRGII